MKSLNLASQPFRNQRLPTVLAGVSLVAALLVSGYHVLLARDVMPDRTSALTQQLMEMEAESQRMRAEETSFEHERLDKATLAQWTLLKELVDRRVFSWSGLFSVLEETLPDGVRLVSLAPRVEKGQVKLEVIAVARSFDDALELVRKLEERPEFADVWPRSRGTGTEGIDIHCEMKYLPQPRQAEGGAAAPAPSPAPAPSGEPGPAAAVASARAVVAQ